MRVKILFSISYYHPYVSGLTLAASRWAEGLVKSGHTVSVLTMKHLKKLGDIEVVGGVRLVRAKPFFKVSKGFLSWDWVVKSWQLAQENDVIVVNLPQFEGVIPALIGKIVGKQIIVVYHCEIVTTPYIQWVLEIFHLITLVLSDVVVTYTADYAISSKLLRLLALPTSHKMKYIVPPIPKPKENKMLTKQLRMKVTSSAIHRRGGVGDIDHIIGIAARLAAEKGFEYALEALERVSGTLVVAGPLDPVGEKVYKDKIMELVKKYKERVIFLGEIAPGNMGSFYRLLDVLILPSVNSTEAFGMVQIEAMRWGVPVVASDLPGVRVPVRQTGMGRIVPPNTSDALAFALADILRNPARYRKDISSFFVPERSVRAFESLLVHK